MSVEEVLDHLLVTVPAEEVWNNMKREFPRLRTAHLVAMLEKSGKENAQEVIARIRNGEDTSNHHAKRGRDEDDALPVDHAGECHNQQCRETIQNYKRGFYVRSNELLEVQRNLIRVQEGRNEEMASAHREFVRLQEARHEEVARLQEARHEEVARLQEARNEEVARLQEARHEEVASAQRELIQTLRDNNQEMLEMLRELVTQARRPHPPRQ